MLYCVTVTWIIGLSDVVVGTHVCVMVVLLVVLILDGRCDERIRHVLDAGFNSTEDSFKEDIDLMNDLVIGKLVEISLHGFVSFKDPNRDSHHLDLNWKRLCNMAQPVVDEQLAHIGIMGNWINKPIKVNLGSMTLGTHLFMVKTPTAGMTAIAFKRNASHHPQLTTTVF
jgi:hypothetical protein